MRMFHLHKANMSHRLGLTLGALLGLVHLGWALLVAAGLAEPLVSFVYRVHFISDAPGIAAFALGDAVLLVLVTSVAGYVLGRLAGGLWIAIGKKMK